MLPSLRASIAAAAIRTHKHTALPMWTGPTEPDLLTEIAAAKSKALEHDANAKRASYVNACVNGHA